MTYFVQDSATQARAESARAESAAVAATMTQPPPNMANPGKNVGYLVAVYIEAVLLFGGYFLLMYRRNATLRDRQKSARSGR
jgi:cytochrome oxidase assembly protein ShyY1